MTPAGSDAGGRFCVRLGIATLGWLAAAVVLSMLGTRAPAPGAFFDGLTSLRPASLAGSAASAGLVAAGFAVQWPRLGRVTVAALAGGLLSAVAALLAAAAAVTGLGQAAPVLSLPGIVAGALVAWAADPTRLVAVHPGERPAAMTWSLAIMVALALAAIPSIVGAWSGGGPGALLAGAAKGGYQAIRGAILWAPLGVIAALAGHGDAARRWCLAAVLAYAVSPLLWASALPLAERLEFFAALPGLAAGLGLGAQLARWLPDEAVPAFQAQPVRGAGGTTAATVRAHRHAVTVHRDATDGSGPIAAVGLGSEGAAGAAVPWAPVAIPLWRRLAGLACVGLAVGLALGFPRFAWPLAAAVVACAAALARWPRAWLVILPAALPALDLAPWTGRFFLDEFDLLLLAVAGATLASSPWCSPAPRERVSRGLPLAFALSCLASLAAGLWPGASVAAPDAFASYWSPYNALRVGKGFLWGYLLFALWVRLPDREAALRLSALGFAAGLGLASTAALWEHWAFAGAASRDYRVTGTFSSMHVGGGHIEAYLAAALPFAWAALRSSRSIALRLLLGAVFAATIYAVVTTVARGGIVALAAVFAVIGVGMWRAGRGRPRGVRRWAGWAALAAGAALLVAGVAGAAYLKERFASTWQDARIRLDHWGDGLAMISGGLAWSVGEGLGSYPRLNLVHHPDPRRGSYGFVREGEETFLRLNSGGDLYMAQHVDVVPGTSYALELDLRSDGRSQRLEFSLCEKKLFNSRRCEWRDVQFPAGGWHRRSVRIDAGDIGEGGPLTRRPVQFSFYNPGAATVVDIDNVRLLDPSGADLLANGDFSRGGDRWFFKSGDHLAWHVKNLWVHLLIEQGLAGFVAFNLLAGAAMLRLGAAMWRGEAAALPWCAALTALLVVGAVDSIVDAPRLTILLMLAALIGATGATGERPNASAAAGTTASRSPPHRPDTPAGHP